MQKILIVFGEAYVCCWVQYYIYTAEASHVMKEVQDEVRGVIREPTLSGDDSELYLKAVIKKIILRIPFSTPMVSIS